MNQDILTLAALVAAFVGVAKGYGLPAKHNSLLAIVVAAVFVLVPDQVRIAIITIATVGLTASGAYSYTKRKEGKPNGK
jgi:choline-glycine betaine transporter